MRGWKVIPATPASSTSRSSDVDALGRSLTVTGSPDPSRAARAIATAWSASCSSAAPAPVFITFGTGQPMLMSIRSAPSVATCAAAERMISGSWPNSWIETGPPSRSRGSIASSSSCVFWLP